MPVFDDLANVLGIGRPSGLETHTNRLRIVSFTNVGAPNTPHEIKQFRHQVMDMFRYLGQPVIHKHRYSPDDVRDGTAKRCPACFDDEYGNVRQDCPVCFGTGYVSTIDHPAKWINDSGRLTTSATATRAPLWGGFGQSYLTWVAEPDVQYDTFKINDEGIFQRIANATAVAPWYPDMNDNDLLIDVEVSGNNEIQNIGDRYELKMSNPITIRGFGIRTRGRHEHKVQQTFQMALLAKPHHFYNVPIDSL